MKNKGCVPNPTRLVCLTKHVINQMVKTTELWEYREFDRSLTPKLGNDFNHLEQVRRFILKKGFQEPLIISCDLHTGCAYLTEGNHHLWIALREKNPFCTLPCDSSMVGTHWII